MNSLNLFDLSKSGVNIAIFERYEQLLSNRREIKKAKIHEVNSFHSLVNILLDNKLSHDDFDGFYFSYEIPQIGKEFDLLKINENNIVNIELKSEFTTIEKLSNQLQRNKYYLSHLRKELYQFTYISSSQTFYSLDDNNRLIETTVSELVKYLLLMKDYFNGDLDELFRASNYLVSPLNTPLKFLRNDYFLTPHQEEITNSIILHLTDNSSSTIYFGITGGPGTGKTLTLYNLAMELSITCKICIIHCGMLCDGHHVINRKSSNIRIISAKEFEDTNFEQFDFVFVDEAHRFYKRQLEKLISDATKSIFKCVFSYDRNQTLSRTENNNDVTGVVRNLQYFEEYKLTDKIRTNRQLASFIRRMFNLNHNDILPDYSSIKIVFAQTDEIAQTYIRAFKTKKYVFINYTKSNYKSGSTDQFGYDFNTHQVIGQEFDKVVMIIDKAFYYNSDGRLVGIKHPNPDYLYYKLLFQGLTRVRENLAIIVVNNYTVFEKMLSIIT
ncbi:ATP-binding protein [Erysipelothrix sp. HDW6B]|uniref:ATP-binding protein n=1 Tax=Erysipelothrix sp. HDW6B TaxID=2714929 RepID=UPI001407F76F|nr:ATP-binding protein [Erysipelothrix sp. HDW6B]QIK86622.1 ATP-binding protein [Erysipelothrix sp. HDW6B]